MLTSSLFVEVDCAQRHKHSQNICGDAFFSRKIPAEDRIIAVLSDGLGSGVKANILANMTGTMALKFAAANRNIVGASEVIMDSLPICQVRKISYATFTIVDCIIHGKTRIVEQGNPNYILIRDGKAVDISRRTMMTARWKDRALQVSEICTRPEDRLIVFSDGVSQAGLGSDRWKLGWRVEGCSSFVEQLVAKDSNISGRELAQAIVDEAERHEPQCRAMDDITCAVFYFRKPRRTLVLSGPPYDQSRDREIATKLDHFEGRKAICGGTTANIVGRELNRDMQTVLSGFGDLPPLSEMEGLDLVTEGILTLTRMAQYLEQGTIPDDPAGKLANLLLDSDHIEFLVGTRINDAHQDPNLPLDLEIRRNIIKRIMATLEERYLKETIIQYI